MKRLLNHPLDTIKLIPELFEYRAIFIQKPSGGLRPIAIQETILNVLHRVLLRMIQKDVFSEQMALEK